MLNIQQKAIFDLGMEILEHNFKQVIQVSADPGTGKSHLSREFALEVAKQGYSVLYVTLTNDDIDRMAAKVNHPNLTICTNHKAGMQQFPERFKVDSSRSLLTTYLMSQKVGKQINSIIKLIMLAKSYLINSIDDLTELSINYGLKISSENIGIASNALKLQNIKNPDVDDLVYLPAINNWVKKSYDLVIVDEYQDSSLAQIVLNNNISTKLMLVVGDEKQGVYYFRGGYFQQIENSLKMELNITYRFGQVIADHVNGKYGTHMQCNNPDIQGKITNESLDFQNLDNDDLIIARTNGELLSPAIKLLAMGKQVRLSNPFVVDQIAHTILNHAVIENCPKCNKPLSAKTSKKDFGDSHYFTCSDYANSRCKGFYSPTKLHFKSKQEILESLQTYTLTQLESATNEEKDTLEDLHKIYVYLLENYKLNEISKMTRKIVTSKHGTLLSTAHKAKGNESPKVHILQSGFDKCMQAAKKEGKEVQIQQEVNLQFVADTRAINLLNYVPIM